MKLKIALIITGIITSIIVITSCSTEDKKALKVFVSQNSNLLIYPVHILSNQTSSFDTIISKKIAKYINDNNYAAARVTQLCPPANTQWVKNEGKMLTNSINLFTAFVKSNNVPKNTYNLNIEFLKRGNNSRIFAVHYCLLNNKGEISMKGLLNSLWKEFKTVNPKTNDDCVAVFINGFEQKIKDSKE